jgi:LCP family protein required for cell wall assembly
VDENDRPRPSGRDRDDVPRGDRPGAPRRPVRSRARPGGSVRAVPQKDGSSGPRPGETRTRAMPTFPPRQEQPEPPSPSHYGVHHASPDQGLVRPAAAPAGGGPGDGGGPSVPQDPPTGRRGRRHRFPRPVRLTATVLAFVLIVLIGWVGGLTLWTNSRIDHVDALSGAANTPGTTYLIAGSDERGGEAVDSDGTEGKRTDTMMLLHKAPGGKSYLVSLPRDTLVDIPGKGKYKLNAAFAFGGPKLLVKTVEGLTGLTIDHYVEVGFDGVEKIVDAVGTVNLCIDQDVDDRRSGLKMTKGCHDMGGDQALAFVRARYFDATADIGRQKRQQEFIGSLMDAVTSPGVLLNPVTQVKLAGAGGDSLTTSKGTGLIDIGRAGLGMRNAMNNGRNLTMPIEDPNYQTNNSGVAILVDDQEVKDFFADIRDGKAQPESSDSQDEG